MKTRFVDNTIKGFFLLLIFTVLMIQIAVERSYPKRQPESPKYYNLSDKPPETLEQKTSVTSDVKSKLPTYSRW